MYIQIYTSVTALNIKQFMNTVNGLCVEVSIQCCLKGGLSEINTLSECHYYSFITRHCMVQGNTLQSNSYQPVRQDIYLQTTQSKVQKTRVGQQ